MLLRRPHFHICIIKLIHTHKGFLFPPCVLFILGNKERGLFAHFFHYTAAVTLFQGLDSVWTAACLASPSASSVQRLLACSSTSVL